jgi:hypothetical protein
LGIISELTLEKSGKNAKKNVFDQPYWLKVTFLLKKKPTCFKSVERERSRGYE